MGGTTGCSSQWSPESQSPSCKQMSPEPGWVELLYWPVLGFVGRGEVDGLSLRAVGTG